MNMKHLVALCVACAFAAPSFGVILASDNAADSAYSNGWQHGDNGGFGFGAWSITQSNSGSTAVTTSTSNGFGVITPNIDTAGRALGILAGPASTIVTGRSIVNSGPAKYVSLDFDLGLTTIGTTTLVVGNYGVIYDPTQATLKFSDGSASTIAWTGTAMRLEVFRFASNNTEIKITDLASLATDSHVITNNLGALSSIGFGAVNTSVHPQATSFINNMVVTDVVPEPATLILLTAGAGALAARRRKK